jgi:16S rRNA (guanine527-N7)-methyltransferase
LVALHYQSGWFINHQQVIVLIKDRPTRMKKSHRSPSPKTPKKKYLPPKQRRTESLPDPRTLAALFQQCGVKLTARQIEQLWTYHGLLRNHNTELNLTRIHNFSNMVLKLYVDAVLPAQFTELPSPLMDLGTGPGMPGIPLKIIRPDIDIVLAEGRAKRVQFLRETIAVLGLKGMEVIPHKITPVFDRPMAGVITRAVESIENTLERIRGCLIQGGKVFFMKGPGCDPEIEQAHRRFMGSYALLQNRAYRIGQTRHERRLVVFEHRELPPRMAVEQAVRKFKRLTIESEQNGRFKALKKLLTSRGIKKAGQCIISGSRPVKEMLDGFPERCLAWITVKNTTPPPTNRPLELDWIQLSEPLFQTLDVFGTHHPLLCIQATPLVPWDPVEGFIAGCNLMIPFQDPENVGAVLRSAAAFQVSQVILLAESAYPYHPKSLRAFAGGLPRMPLRQGPSLQDLPIGLPVLALSAEGSDIGRKKFPSSFGLLAGLEGPGLPRSWRKKAIRIPIDEINSLNGATAIAIALYEWSRRKKDQPPME